MGRRLDRHHAASGHARVVHRVDLGGGFPDQAAAVVEQQVVIVQAGGRREQGFVDPRIQRYLLPRVRRIRRCRAATGRRRLPRADLHGPVDVLDQPEGSGMAAEDALVDGVVARLLAAGGGEARGADLILEIAVFDQRDVQCLVGHLGREFVGQSFAAAPGVFARRLFQQRGVVLANRIVARPVVLAVLDAAVVASDVVGRYEVGGVGEIKLQRRGDIVREGLLREQYRQGLGELAIRVAVFVPQRFFQPLLVQFVGTAAVVEGGIVLGTEYVVFVDIPGDIGQLVLLQPVVPGGDEIRTGITLPPEILDFLQQRPLDGTVGLLVAADQGKRIVDPVGVREHGGEAFPEVRIFRQGLQGLQGRPLEHARRGRATWVGMGGARLCAAPRAQCQPAHPIRLAFEFGRLVAGRPVLPLQGGRDPAQRLLRDVPGFVRQVPVLSRRQVDLAAERIGRRAVARRSGRAVMHAHAVQVDAGQVLDAALQRVGQAGSIRRRGVAILRGRRWGGRLRRRVRGGWRGQGGRVGHAGGAGRRPRNVRHGRAQRARRVMQRLHARQRRVRRVGHGRRGGGHDGGTGRRSRRPARRMRALTHPRPTRIHAARTPSRACDTRARWPAADAASPPPCLPRRPGRPRRSRCC